MVITGCLRYFFFGLVAILTITKGKDISIRSTIFTNA